MCKLLEWLRRLFKKENVKMKEIKAVQKFRHRGFQPADEAAERVQIFGNGPAPTNPDGSPMKEIWDNDIEQIIVTRKHVDVPGEDDATQACTPSQEVQS